MARELHNGLDDMVREAEINEIKDEANSVMSDHINPDGILTRDLDLSETQRDWSRAIDDFKETTSPERNLDLDRVEGFEDIQEQSTLSDAKDGLKTQNNKTKA